MFGWGQKIPSWLRYLVSASPIVLPLLFGWVWWVISPESPDERAEVVKSFAQIFGSAALIFGVYFTWKNLEVNQNNQRINEKNQRETENANRKREKQTQEAQYTDRFTKAVEQLGSKEIAIRLGGIYALERLAKDSERDYWTIMEVLISYLRMQTLWDTEVSPSRTHKSHPGSGHPKWESPADVAAILIVLRRRQHYFGNGEDQVIDLNNTDLRGANFIGARLENANFQSAHLEGANFTGAHLEEAIFANSWLGLAVFRDATLTGAIFYHSNGSNTELAATQP